MPKKAALRTNGARTLGAVYQNDNLERMDSSINALQALIDGIVKDIDPVKIKCETVGDIHKLSNAVSNLSRARTEQEKLRLEAVCLVNEASQNLKAAIQHEMRNEPELIVRLREVISRAEDNLNISEE
jgi:hypothetical protein